MLGSKRLRGLVALGLIVLALASAAGWLGDPASAVTAPRFSAPAREYLRSSSEQSVRFLVALSAAKTSLAIVEGSSATVSLVFFGASLQVGDVVKALYDAVDYAWTAVLFGCAILFALGYLLDGGFFVGQFTFAFALLFLAASLMIEPDRRARIIVERVCRFFAAITLAVWVAFPAALVLASITSAKITAPRLEEAQREMSLLRESVAPRSDSASGIQDAVQRAKTYLVGKADDVTRALGTIIAGYVLDCVVFPTAFAALLLGFTKRMIGLS